MTIIPLKLTPSTKQNRGLGERSKDILRFYEGFGENLNL